MTYEEAWEKSTGWILHYWCVFSPKRIEYNDYYQECALCFYSSLKPKYEPFVCWCYSKIVYKRVMIKLLYRDKESQKIIVQFNNQKTVQFENDEWSLELRPCLKEVAEYIADGYETAEICKLTGKTRETIYSYVKLIKRAYATELGIKDYQRKHLRSFTRNRTEKELENWKKNKERLAQIAKSRQKIG